MLVIGKLHMNNPNSKMIFTHEDRTYRLSFRYSFSSPQCATICRILDITDRPQTIVAEGETVLSKKDRFVKHIGRDIALGRALMAFENEEFRNLARKCYVNRQWKKQSQKELAGGC